MKMFSILALAATLALAAAPLAAQSHNPDPGRPGYFLIEVNAEHFVAYITDADSAETARAMLAGEKPQQVITGDLEWGDGGFNWADGNCYSWHMDPADIAFADYTPEVCDALPSFVSADTTYWVDYLGYYCPWSARVAAEIAKPKHPDCKSSLQ